MLAPGTLDSATTKIASILVLQPATLLNSLISSSSFLVETSGFPINSIMPSINSNSFPFPLPSWMPVISFSCMVAVARTSNTTLSKSVKSVHPCLVPNLRGKAVSFSPLNLILAMGLAYMVFIMLGYASSVLTLLRVFHHK